LRRGRRLGLWCVVRTLVTGGAGFIGSHVAAALVTAGHEVLVADDLSRGKRQNVPPEAELARVDITTPEVERLVDDFRPEAVFHHAAQADVRHSMRDPVLDAEVNVVGTTRLATAAVRAGTGVFVFASSGGAIYGEQDEYPAPETHATRPASAYGLSKLCAELYLGYFARTSGLRAVALRYANVYGPRQDPMGEAGVVAIFCGRIKRGEALTIYGDGRQTRDFVYVADVVRANLLALEHTQARGSYNIGTGVETEINAVSTELCRIAGRHPGVRYDSAKPGEQRRSVLDCRHALDELGWRAETPLGHGLAQTYAALAAD
jgi:UDP-glucose 4-epimerase